MSWSSRGTWPRQTSSPMAPAVAACPAAGRARHDDQVPMRSPYQIVLADEENTVLMALTRALGGAESDSLPARTVPAPAPETTHNAINEVTSLGSGKSRIWRHCAGAG